MFLKNIKIKNFRNYENLKLDFFNGINIIYGNNAQGKTNLLESIYFLSFSKSHRSFIDNCLINENYTDAYISGEFFNNGDEYKLEIGLDDKRKKLKVDQDEVKKISDYISLSNIIIFYPEDLNLVKGSPKERRHFLNSEISQINNNYLNVINDYNRLLKMRNDYLKKMQVGEIIDENYFAILNKYFIIKATDICIMRHKFIKRLNEFCKDIYLDILGIDNFNIKYVSNIKNMDNYDLIKQEFENILENEKNNEIKYGKTLFGPHRDDVEFYLEQQNLKQYGSQGQQRVAVLALKLAELEIFKKYKNIKPILLLDDVFSELDDKKKNNLLKYISNDLQVFITTTDLSNINKELLKNAKKIKIENASVINVEEVE